MKFEITDAQLRAIINLVDSMSAMIGSGGDNSFDTDTKRDVATVDRMLLKNGYKRKHK